MVLKCCVPNCKTNYASSNDKDPVYKLLQNTVMKIKRSVLLLYLELTLLFQNIRLYVENTGAKMQHLFLYTANRDQKTHPLFFLIFQPAACDQHEKTFQGQQNKVCLVRAGTLKMK